MYDLVPRDSQFNRNSYSCHCRVKEYQDGLIVVSICSFPSFFGFKNNHSLSSDSSSDSICDLSEKYLKDSVKRSKNSVFDYAHSNKWDWFVTFTFSPDKVDRQDYDACYKSLKGYLDYCRRRHPDVKYLFVPELHKDGCSFHFHGLMSGVPDDEFISSGHRDRSGKDIFNCLYWRKGFSDASRVADSSKVSSYILKYITKSMVNLTKGKHRFIFSRNLHKPHLIIGDFSSIDDLFESIYTLRDATVLYSKVNFNEEIGYRQEYYYLTKCSEVKNE